MGELVDKFKIKLDKAKLLFKTGQRPILDVSKAEVDYANSRLQYEKSINNETLLKTKLFAEMGIIDDDIDFMPVKVDELPGLRFDLPALNKLAEEYYPEIKISRMRTELSKINISAAKSDHMPVVDFLASVGFENTNLHGWKTKEEIKDKADGENWEVSSHFGLRARMPVDFLSGGAIEARVDAAVAEYNMFTYNEKKVLVKMRALVRTYYQSMNEIKKQIEISVPIIDNANKHLMLAQRSYESGLSTQLDMQDAEMAVLEAKLNLLKARYDYLIALGDLSNVIGLGEEYLCEKK
jgi:HAE1 family hydrophobic/amphiphilic exporter-1